MLKITNNMKGVDVISFELCPKKFINKRSNLLGRLQNIILLFISVLHKFTYLYEKIY